MKIVIEGEPVPKARPRKGNGNFYTPAKSKAYEDLVAWHVMGKPTFEGDLLVRVIFFCSPRKTQPDLDNLLKSLLDGLQKGGLFRDDVQVAQIEAMRLTTERNPRVEFNVLPLDGVSLLELE